MSTLQRHAVVLWFMILCGCAALQQESTPADSPASATPAPITNHQTDADQELVCDPRAGQRSAVRVRHIHAEAFANDTPRVKAATPEDLRAAHERMAKARHALLDGEPFEKVWAAYSDKHGEIVGDLGFVNRGVFVREFERVAFCLPIGATSPVIRTVFGYHVVQVTDVRY